MNFLERIGFRKKELVDLETKAILVELKKSIDLNTIATERAQKAFETVDRRHYREKQRLTNEVTGSTISTNEPGEIPKSLW